MKINIKNRVLQEAITFTTSNKTLRTLAQELGVSKSTIHKDLKERLPLIDVGLSTKANDLLILHLKSRHIKGGESTRLKYKKIK